MPRFLTIFLFWGGVICNFGFGLREKVGNLDFRGGGYSATEKSKSRFLTIFLFFGGGICNFGFGLREKVGNLDFPGGGILQLKSQSAKISDNFRGGGILQLKSQSAKISDNFLVGGWGGYSATSDLVLGKKLEIWIFQGGGNLQLKKSQSTKIYLNMNFPFYYSLFHSCLGYYIYLLLFPIIFTLLLIFH